MNDSNSHHTIVSDHDVPIPSVVHTLSWTLDAEVDEDMIIPRKNKGNDTSVTASVKIPKTTLYNKGLVKTKLCKTSVEMEDMIGPLISKKLIMTEKVTTILLVQMSAYFTHTGIHNEEHLSFMTSYVNWPPPQTITTASQKMNLISIPVTLLLLKIAKYMIAIKEEKLYLSPGIEYYALSIWFTKYTKNSKEKE